MTPPATLLVRADAGPQIGTGHLMRSLALAQAWRSAGRAATFITCCKVEGLRDRIHDAGARLVPLQRPHPDPTDLRATLAVVAEARSESKSSSAASNPTWLVLDGYHFDAAYQRALRDAGARVMVVDDLAHQRHYHADVLLNQNLGAEDLDYACDTDTVLLLGCRYALLRPEFRRFGSFRRETPKTARRLLVTLGGADPDNVTAKVIAALASGDLSRLHAKVMVGSANPHLETLRDQVRHGPGNIELLTDVTDVAGPMAWADLALSAAGSTAWELAFMQVPVVLLTLAENQEPIARQMAAAGAATSLGRTENLTADTIAQQVTALCRRRNRRAAQSRAGRRLVDGRGAERVVAVCEALGDSSCPPMATPEVSISEVNRSALTLRPATPEDARPLWRLTNDPAVRRVALVSADRIPWGSHLRWFRRRLASPGTCIWVLDFHGLVLAQIRCNRIGAATAEISVSVAPAFRRRGLASRLVELTCSQARDRLGVARLRAIVRTENLASARTFAKAGFTLVGTHAIHGHPCHVYEHYQPVGFTGVTIPAQQR